MIRNIIFDVGNVLVDFRWWDYMKDLGFSDEVTQYLGEKMVMNPLWNELDRGVFPLEETVEKIKQAAPEYPREAALFFEKIVDIVRNRPYAKSWIHELKQRGYKVFILSNYPKKLWETHEESRFDFLTEVDGKVVSGFVKMIKPDLKIYEYLCDTYGLTPQECVFLDDRKPNIDAALQVGMQGILFENYEQAREELEVILKHD